MLEKDVKTQYQTAPLERTGRLFDVSPPCFEVSLDWPLVATRTELQPPPEMRRGSSGYFSPAPCGFPALTPLAVPSILRPVTLCFDAPCGAPSPAPCSILVQTPHAVTPLLRSVTLPLWRNMQCCFSRAPVLLLPWSGAAAPVVRYCCSSAQVLMLPCSHSRVSKNVFHATIVQLRRQALSKLSARQRGIKLWGTMKSSGLKLQLKLINYIEKKYISMFKCIFCNYSQTNKNIGPYI